MWPKNPWTFGLLHPHPKSSSPRVDEIRGIIGLIVGSCLCRRILVPRFGGNGGSTVLNTGSDKVWT